MNKNRGITLIAMVVTIISPIYEKQEYDEERGEIETYFNYDFTVDYGDGTVVNVKSKDSTIEKTIREKYNSVAYLKIEYI